MKKEKKYYEKQQETKFFKLSIWIYQKFGYVTSYVRDIENSYITENINTWYKKYNRTPSLKKQLSFGTYVSIQIGTWQGKVGLYTTWKRMNRFYRFKRRVSECLLQNKLY